MDSADRVQERVIATEPIHFCRQDSSILFLCAEMWASVVVKSVLSEVWHDFR